MWAVLGHKETIAYSAWPLYDESKLVSETVLMVVQVNGKLRDKMEVPVDASEETVIDQALKSDKIQSFLSGHTLLKTIVVARKLVNFVIR